MWSLCYLLDYKVYLPKLVVNSIKETVYLN